MRTRYPIIYQHDATDCGPAVLAMIAAHYRKRISISRLRELSGTDRRGTTLAGLSTAAEHVGFSPNAVRATPGALAQLTLPAIAHFHNHYVVLYKVTRKHCLVGDPAFGLHRLSREQFLKAWTGAMLLLAPTTRLNSLADSKSPLSKLLGFLLPHYRLFLDACLAAVSMTLLGLALSYFIQVLVDSVLVQKQTPALNTLAFGMLIVMFARAGFLGVRSHLLAHLSRGIDADTVLGYHRHLLGLPLTFFSSRRAGEILSRLNDAVKIRLAGGVTTLSIVLDAMLVLTTAAIMMLINWRLTLQSLQFTPALFGIVWLFNRPMRRHQRAAMEEGAEVEARIVETIGTMPDIKSFRAETRIAARTKAKFDRMQYHITEAQRIAAFSTTVSSLLISLSSLALLFFGAHGVMNGTLTIGRLMAFYTLLGAILGPLERLALANPSIQEAMIAADRLSDIMDLPLEAARERPDATDDFLKGAIEFQDAGFAYGSRHPIFEHMDLKIEPGECVGIDGPSGCGKTTLVRLIARLYDPSSGRIILDGVDTRSYTFACLRREIAYVPQDIVLMNGTIEDNIRLGAPGGATLEQVRAAAEAAGLRLDSAACHSRLERQRIALARVILANPSILILDEPMHDPAVQALLDSRRGRRTTIVVSPGFLNVDRLISHGLNGLNGFQSV